MDNQNSVQMPVKKPSTRFLLISTVVLIIASSLMPVAVSLASFDNTKYPTLPYVVACLTLIFILSVLIQTAVLFVSNARNPIVNSLRFANKVSIAMSSSLILAIILFAVAIYVGQLSSTMAVALLLLVTLLFFVLLPTLVVITIIFSFRGIQEAKK